MGGGWVGGATEFFFSPIGPTESLRLLPSDEAGTHFHLVQFVKNLLHLHDLMSVNQKASLLSAFKTLAILQGYEAGTLVQSATLSNAGGGGGGDCKTASPDLPQFCSGEAVMEGR